MVAGPTQSSQAVFSNEQLAQLEQLIKDQTAGNPTQNAFHASARTSSVVYGLKQGKASTSTPQQFEHCSYQTRSITHISQQNPPVYLQQLDYCNSIDSGHIIHKPNILAQGLVAIFPIPYKILVTLSK